ncbi:MAG: pentapeptide repeat-containing protein, partial [Vampirovibrionales bacterium]
MGLGTHLFQLKLSPLLKQAESTIRKTAQLAKLQLGHTRYTSGMGQPIKRVSLSGLTIPDAETVLRKAERLQLAQKARYQDKLHSEKQLSMPVHTTIYAKPGTDFQGLNAPGSQVLQGARLQGVILDNATLGNSNLRGTHLRDASLNKAILEAADLRGADLTKANLSHASLKHAQLNGANLSNTAADCTNFNRANLEAADLRGADLTKANLSHASLKHAQLNGANLS